MERNPHGQVTTEVVDDHILLVTIDRVEKRNAFTPEIARELAEALTRLDDDPDLFVGVLTFAGDHTTAGLELPLFFGPDAEVGQPPGAVDPYGLGRRLSKPLVTAVQGITLALQHTIANARLALDEDEPAAVAALDAMSKAVMATADFQEGIASFVERRPAQFRGR